MVGTLMRAIGLDGSALAGSVITSFGNHCTMINGSKYFVAETCEYQRHFMEFHPRKILLTSIESDHQDYYPTYESILSAFMQYIDLLPQFGELIYCADDPGACEAAKMIFSSRPDLVFTAYGEKAIGNYQLSVKGIRDERLVFTLKGFSGEFRLRIPGRHNARNAAGAIALAASLAREEKGELDFTDIGRLREGTEIVSGSAESLSRSAADSIVALGEMQRSEKTIAQEEKAQGTLIAKASDEIRRVAETAKNVENQVMVQSSAIQQSSASVNEMAASVESVAKMAREAEGLSTALIRSSGQGSGAISSAIGSINDIQTASAAVAEIVKSIHDIANRTNLLSMNAAIEAAHAGNAGKGFAIVANEVRSLAESSSKSASEIQKHITAMIDKIDRGVSSISDAGKSFSDITTGIGQTAELIQTITRAMEEQRVGASETTKATASVVEAIDAIRELSRKQREYAVSMESAMGEITSAAGTIGDALRESGVRSQKLDAAMKNVDRSIVDHDKAVTTMKDDIGIFRL